MKSFLKILFSSLRKKISIIPNLVLMLICLSCEEPDDPVIIFDPTNTNTVGKTITSIDIFWDEATVDNFDRYEIYYKTFFETEYKKYVSLTNKSQIFTTLAGLIPNTEYNIFIRTIDKNGNNWNSNIIKAFTFSDVPSQFEKFVISAYSFGYITLLWSPYKDSYAVPFSRYEIYMGYTEDFVCNDSSKCLVIDQIDIYEAVIAGLVDKQGYYFKVRVYNKLEKYSESPVLYQKTPNQPPAATFLYDPENVTESSARLRWRRSKESDFDHYAIHLSDEVDFQPTLNNIYKIVKGRNDTVLDLTGLTKNKDYVFRISVFDELQDFSSSNYAGFTATNGGGLPIPEITGMTYDNPNKKVTVIWTGNDSKLFATYYIWMGTDSVLVYNMRGSIYSEGNRTKSNYTFAIGQGVRYYFKIDAVNVFGKHSLSKVKSAYIP